MVVMARHQTYQHKRWRQAKGGGMKAISKSVMKSARASKSKKKE